MSGFVIKYLGPVVSKMFGPDFDINTQNVLNLTLQPLTDIYLHANVEQEIGDSGDIKVVMILIAVALLILLIACINFINLSIARSITRKKEVVVRKVMGAARSLLVRQFIGEALVLILAALLIAVILVHLILPVFNAFTLKQLSLSVFATTLFFPGLLFILVVGLAACAYPAFYITSFQPAFVLKSAQRSGSGGNSGIRKLLVIMQFSISVILFIATLVVLRQMQYVKNRNLGFEKEMVVVVTCDDKTIWDQMLPLKNELLKNPQILNVALASEPLGEHNYYFNPGFVREGESGSQITPFTCLATDDDFIRTLEIDVVAGRGLSLDFAEDARSQSVLINEAGAARLGWIPAEKATGQRIMRIEQDEKDRELVRIAGVIRDFNYTSLHRKIEPLLLFIRSGQESTLSASTGHLRYIYVRLAPGNVGQTLSHMRKTFQLFSPHYPVKYSFLDERYGRLYEKERRIGRIFAVCAGLAIFIAALGLFGLASFLTQLRTKEIGIRKSLGATVGDVTVMLIREFVVWVLWANAVAWPLAYWVMHWWLGQFAYRTNLALWIFPLSALFSAMVAVYTVSSSTVKVAKTDPVKTLRYE